MGPSSLKTFGCLGNMGPKHGSSKQMNLSSLRKHGSTKANGLGSPWKHNSLRNLACFLGEFGPICHG